MLKSITDNKERKPNMKLAILISSLFTSLFVAVTNLGYFVLALSGAVIGVFASLNPRFLSGDVLEYVPIFLMELLLMGLAVAAAVISIVSFVRKNLPANQYNGLNITSCAMLFAGSVISVLCIFAIYGTPVFLKSFVFPIIGFILVFAVTALVIIRAVTKKPDAPQNML